MKTVQFDDSKALLVSYTGLSDKRRPIRLDAKTFALSSRIRPVRSAVGQSACTVFT